MTSALSYVPTTAKIRSCISLRDKLSMVADLFMLFLCYPFYHAKALRGIPIVLYMAMRDYKVQVGQTTFVLPGNCPPENTLMADWYEPEVRRIIQSFDGGVFVDCGAGIGLYTLMAAKNVNKVVSIEPDPLMWGRLEKSILENKLDNVSLFKAAAMSEDTKGKAGLYGHPFARFQSSMKEGSQWASLRCIVDTVKIDSIIPEGSPVLMKLDVEGAEPEAMVGALKTLLRKDVTVIFEALSPEALQRSKRIIEPLGYCITRLSERDYLARR